MLTLKGWHCECALDIMISVGHVCLTAANLRPLFKKPLLIRICYQLYLVGFWSQYSSCTMQLIACRPKPICDPISPHANTGRLIHRGKKKGPRLWRRWNWDLRQWDHVWIAIMVRLPVIYFKNRNAVVVMLFILHSFYAFICATKKLKTITLFQFSDTQYFFIMKTLVS